MELLINKTKISDFLADVEACSILAYSRNDTGNSCPGTARLRLSPLFLWVVGYQSNSFDVTPAA